MALTDDEIEHDMRLAAFDQDRASFRSLNQQLWQFPLIYRTLTGGLWFREAYGAGSTSLFQSTIACGDPSEPNAIGPGRQICARPR